MACSYFQKQKWAERCRENLVRYRLDTLEVFEQGNLTQKEINLAVNVLRENGDKILNKIQTFANGEKTKPIRL